MRLAPALFLATAFLPALARAQQQPPATGAQAGDAQVGDARAGGAQVGDGHAANPATEARARRAGVVLGLMGGFGVAGASGYPNSASKIDDPSYYSSSDLLGGSGGSFFLMGAIADYVNFGFWFGGGTFQSKDWRSTGGGGGLRVELFPLYALVPKLKDLGVLGQFGLGSTKLEAKHGDFVPANGTQSFIATGVFYELPIFRMLGGHVAGGPSFEYDAIFSRSVERHWAMLGGRIAFYGGI
jgi:hypothetical protein